MTSSQLACTYATLALFDDDVDITAENIQKLLKAANVEVETYWPGLFEGLVKEKGVGELICGACKGGGGGGGCGAPGPTDEVKEAGAKENDADADAEAEEEESSSKSGPGIFDSDSSSDDSNDSD